jgi:hypothetical protein
MKELYLPIRSVNPNNWHASSHCQCVPGDIANAMASMDALIMAAGPLGPAFVEVCQLGAPTWIGDKFFKQKCLKDSSHSCDIVEVSSLVIVVISLLGRNLTTLTSAVICTAALGLSLSNFLRSLRREGIPSGDVLNQTFPNGSLLTFCPNATREARL